MRPYEIVVIFDADLEEEAIRAGVDRFVEQLRQHGEPGTVEHWGKRRFAYELRHRWEGSYVLLRARAEPQAIEELDRAMTLSDDVLRHRVVRIPEHVYEKSVPTAATAEA